MSQALLARTLAAVLLVLAVAGCSNALTIRTTGGSDFAPPPLPEGMARIFFYRDTPPDGSTVSTMISIDRREVGPAIPGGSSFVDIKPGTHVIGASVASNGNDTERRFQLKAGQIGYVSVQVAGAESTNTMGNAVGYGPQLIFPYGNMGEQVLKRLRFYGAAKVD